MISQKEISIDWINKVSKENRNADKRRTFNILDKNLLKGYLKALGLYFWPFQRRFKAVFGYSGFLGWEPEFLCAFSVACLNVKKTSNFERIIYFKGGF
jgi:hypothetical protein